MFVSSFIAVPQFANWFRFSLPSAPQPSWFCMQNLSPALRSAGAGATSFLRPQGLAAPSFLRPHLSSSSSFLGSQCCHGAHHGPPPSLLTAFWSTHLSFTWQTLALACMLPVTPPPVPFSRTVSTTPTIYPCQQSKSSYDYIWRLSNVYNFRSTSGSSRCVPSIPFCPSWFVTPLPSIPNKQRSTFRVVLH